MGKIDAGAIQAAMKELFEYQSLGSIEYFRRLVRADMDGRLAELPCKVGDTVYWVHNGTITRCRVNRIQQNRNGLFICLRSKVSHGAFREDFIGKTIFLTMKEAEAANVQDCP